MKVNIKIQHFTKNIRYIFLNLKNKILLWLLNKFVAKENEYYGFEKPSVEWMNLHNKNVCKRQIIGVYKRSTACDILQTVLLDN